MSGKRRDQETIQKTICQQYIIKEKYYNSNQLVVDQLFTVVANLRTNILVTILLVIFYLCIDSYTDSYFHDFQSKLEFFRVRMQSYEKCNSQITSQVMAFKGRQSSSLIAQLGAQVHDLLVLIPVLTINHLMPVVTIKDLDLNLLLYTNFQIYRGSQFG